MDNHYASRSMPPPPPPLSVSAQNEQDAVYDRYKRLKRHYVELEQKFHTMCTDLQRAGEQNRRLARERDMLLDRIHEMSISPPPPPPSSTSAASTSLATSSRSASDVYSSRSAPPPIRSSREAALQRFLEEDSEDDIPPPRRRPSMDYDRREFTANGIDGVENGNRPHTVPDGDRYSYPPPPAGPVNSTSSHPVYSSESTSTHRHRSSASVTSHSQLQAHINNNDGGNNNTASTQSSRLHHPSHPIHEPYYAPYVHSGPRSRTPPSVSPLSEYSSHKRALDVDEEAASKRAKTSQYQQQHLQQSSGSLSKPVSSTSSQSAAFGNGSPSPPIQGPPQRGGRARGGRSRKTRANSVSASSAVEAPVRKRRSRQSKSTRNSSVMPDGEINIHSTDPRSHHDDIDAPLPVSSAPSAQQGAVKERSASPPVPPPSMPMNVIRGGSSPSRSYSPAPPALPPTGPPPRDRISPVADARNLSRSNAHPPQPPPLALPRPRSTKPKRLKAHTVQSKSYSIPTVPRDSRGKPQLPLNVGIMTVRNLGIVCLEKHFHTERYIFPIGYEVTRRYSSMHNPEAEAQYTCTILHGFDVDGGSGPRFRIVASDDVEHPITAGTATGAWSVIVKAANRTRNRQHSNSVSGPDYFGLGQNTIKHLLQELENANLLQDYVRQTFVEGGPLGGRHAAVTAAITLDDRPSEPGSSVLHARPRAHTSKSSSPVDQPHDQEPDESSVMDVDLDREVEGGEGEGNDAMSRGHTPTPPVRSPRGPGPLLHDEEGGYPHSSSKLPSIPPQFNQQPPISQQRGSPTGPPGGHSRSRSSYDSRSPPIRDRDREREKERDRERYGPDSPNMPSGMRGLINPYNSPDGNRSEYFSNSNSRQGQGKGHSSPRSGS